MLLTGIYFLALSLLGVVALLRFRIVDRPTKFICVFIWISLLTEFIALYAAIRFRNNIPVYNLSCVIEFACIALYFNYSITVFQKNRIGYIIAFLGSLAGVLNMAFIQPLSQLNSNFLFIECSAIVCMSLLSVYKLLETDDDRIRIQEYIHFWLPCILIFYQCGALWSWGTYDYFARNHKLQMQLLHTFLISTSILTYTGILLVFLLYPKMKHHV